MTLDEDRPAPDWLGDVAAGVEAWTHGASVPAPAAPRETPPDPVADGPEADPESVARKILLDQLTGQARSRKELADKLAAKNVPDDVATRLLDRFEEVGLVDDEAFARSWIASRQPGKGLARRALAQELRRKGVEDEVAREALDEIDPAAEEEAARALVRKKLRSVARVDDATATRRLSGCWPARDTAPASPSRSSARSWPRLDATASTICEGPAVD
jgi:regulatory protein